jgi:hypothetical protein
MRIRGDENRTRTSAWEAQRSWLFRALTCQPCWSRVTLVDPSSPWPMARNARRSCIDLRRSGSLRALLPETERVSFPIVASALVSASLPDAAAYPPSHFDVGQMPYAQSKRLGIRQSISSLWTFQ